MSPQRRVFNELEAQSRRQVRSVNEFEFANAAALFDRLPYRARQLTDDDIKELAVLLPSVRMQQVENCEVKCKAGPCISGRDITLLDIVSAGLRNGVHNDAFLARLLNGEMGKIVMCWSNAPDELKQQLPANTIFIDQDTLTPCSQCGTLHQVAMKQISSVYLWIIDRMPRTIVSLDYAPLSQRVIAMQIF